MKKALAILLVWGFGILFAGPATAHEYVVYRGHHRHHPVVAVYPRVVVARPVVVAPHAVVVPPVVRYPAYRQVLVPAPVYAPAPVGTFNYYGRGFGISVGF